MAGFSVANNEHLIRSNLWSRALKQLLEDELMAMRFVRMITDFPDGTKINIPSIGQAEVLDYDEGQAVRYTAMDTGNFTFTITQYKQSASFISEKMKQDSYYASDVVSAFVPRQPRALMVAIESRIFTRPTAGQTTSNLNTINGGDHRFVGSGTSETISPKDFARERFALKKGNVVLNRPTAIVDPSVTYALETMTNLINVSFNPNWEGIIRDSMTTGMKFKYNVFGFDIYESNYLEDG